MPAKLELDALGHHLRAALSAVPVRNRGEAEWRRSGARMLPATVAAVRMNRRAIMLDPPTFPGACAPRLEASAEAKQIIDAAGGIARMELVAR
jgi:hypothetical protein